MKRFPSLNIDTTIKIKCQDNREPEAIYDSLLPDNKNFPNNLEMDMKIIDSSLLLKLKFTSNFQKENSIDTLSNTIDEIMEHIEIVKNVIEND
jgi:hypothetical protein